MGWAVLSESVSFDSWLSLEERGRAIENIADLSMRKVILLLRTPNAVIDQIQVLTQRAKVSIKYRANVRGFGNTALLNGHEAQTRGFVAICDPSTSINYEPQIYK